MKVLLLHFEAAILIGTVHHGVITVQLNMILYVCSLVRPTTTQIFIWTLYNQLIQHSCNQSLYFGRRLVGRNGGTAGRTGLLCLTLTVEGLVQAVLAKDMLASTNLAGIDEGVVADEADEVAVHMRDIVNLSEIDGGLRLWLTTLRRR